MQFEDVEVWKWLGRLSTDIDKGIQHIVFDI